MSELEKQKQKMTINKEACTLILHFENSPGKHKVKRIIEQKRINGV